MVVFPVLSSPTKHNLCSYWKSNPLQHCISRHSLHYSSYRRGCGSSFGNFELIPKMFSSKEQESIDVWAITDKQELVVSSVLRRLCCTATSSRRSNNHLTGAGNLLPGTFRIVPKKSFTNFCTVPWLFQLGLDSNLTPHIQSLLYKGSDDSTILFPIPWVDMG